MSSSERDSSGEFTENDGFSVVAATSVTQRFSTLGSSASCCALVNRCTSSMNSTVSVPSGGQPAARVLDDRAHVLDARRSPPTARRTGARTSRRSGTRASSCPCPGGPQSTTEVGAARRAASFAGSTSRRSGEPATSRCSWPATSSSVPRPHADGERRAGPDGGQPGGRRRHRIEQVHAGRVRTRTDVRPRAHGAHRCDSVCETPVPPATMARVFARVGRAVAHHPRLTVVGVAGPRRARLRPRRRSACTARTCSTA